jgi:hypothetical protein
LLSPKVGTWLKRQYWQKAYFIDSATDDVTGHSAIPAVQR